MPNPFLKNTGDSSVQLEGDEVEVIDSELWCERCLDIVNVGAYSAEKKRLRFMCKNGHNNVIKGIEV